MKLGIILGLCLAASLSQKSLATTTFVVSAPQTGSALPFLQAVQNQVRTKIANCAACTSDEKQIEVLLRGGEYYLDKSLVLDARDSAPSGGSIVWKPKTGEHVRILGARRIRNFKSVSPSAVMSPEQLIHLREYDLAANGISWAPIVASGFGLPIIPSHSELFHNGRPMQVSRNPDEGWFQIKSVQDSTHFTLTNGLKLNPEDQTWLYGYWGFDWADEYVSLSSYDSKFGKIGISNPPHYALKAGQRFAILNTLEYLDLQGEYMIDRNGKLLVWAFNTDTEMSDEYLLTLTEEPLIQLSQVKGVQIAGFEMGFTRGEAIEVLGGDSDSISANLIRATGKEGVHIDGGINHRVDQNRFIDTGNEGLIISGGNRATLESSNHVVEQNEFYRFGRIGKTYHPAIDAAGVGIQIKNNEIAHGPHFAIRFAGNENRIEKNHVFDVVRETSDAGAFYIGRDWSMRGNLIRHNYIHDIGANLPGPGAMAVYLDDFSSGTTISENWFYRAGRAAFVGGGRDNIIHSNVFVDCKNAVHVDQRGIEWKGVDFLNGPGQMLVPKMQAVNYLQEPYASKYPELARILSDDPLLAKGNRAFDNVMLSSVSDLGTASVFFKNNLELGYSFKGKNLSTPKDFFENVNAVTAIVAGEEIGVDQKTRDALDARFGKED